MSDSVGGGRHAAGRSAPRKSTNQAAGRVFTLYLPAQGHTITAAKCLHSTMTGSLPPRHESPGRDAFARMTPRASGMLARASATVVTRWTMKLSLQRNGRASLAVITAPRRAHVKMTFLDQRHHAGGVTTIYRGATTRAHSVRTLSMGRATCVTLRGVGIGVAPAAFSHDARPACNASPLPRCVRSSSFTRPRLDGTEDADRRANDARLRDDATPRRPLH